MPTFSDGESYLRDFHSRYPGATSKNMTEARSADGRTSYERLADVVDRAAGSPAVVLDLGCGDGALLELLLRRNRGDLELIGVDMSPAELAAARRRLGSDSVRLLEESAQNLSLPRGSVDVVLCHLALMLMSDLDRVLAELARVLRPGGWLSAVLPGPPVQGDAMEQFGRTIEPLLHQQQDLPAIGDPRVYSKSRLQALFAEKGFLDVLFEPFVVPQDGTPDEVWNRLRLFYWVDLLPAPAQQHLERTLREGWVDLLRPDGTLPCSLGLAQLTARYPESTAAAGR